jgi:membrane protease YdiL (CAAX protease family)
VTFEPNPAETPPRRSPLAPPGGELHGAKFIFWSRTELRAGWRIVLYILFFAAFGAAGVVVSAFLRFPQVTRTSLTASGLLAQEAIVMLAALAAAGVLALLEGRPFGAYGLPGARALRAEFWHGIAWGIAMITAMILLIRSLGGFSFGHLALAGGALWGHAALWGLVFLCVGVFEEFMFRGYTLYTLASGIKFWPAASVLSAIWGASHLNNPGEGWVGACGVFVIGMFFCLTLRRTGNLWFAVGLHTSFDWGETFLFSAPNSGIVAPGHLLNSSFHGPAWLTGGTVGPEGSVFAFVIIGVAAAVFSRVYPPHKMHG